MTLLKSVAIFVLFTTVAVAKPPKWELTETSNATDVATEARSEQLPDELDVRVYDDGVRISGEAAVGKDTVQGKSLEWFGKSVSWTITDASEVPAQLVLTSLNVSSEDESGPKGSVEFSDAQGKKIYRTEVVRKPTELLFLEMDGKTLVIHDLPSGRVKRTVSPQFPLTMKLTVLVRKPGDRASTRLNMEQHFAAIPVVPDIDPEGAPSGNLLGQSTRFYFWRDRATWYVRTTSKKYVQCRGVVRAINGRISGVEGVGFDKGHVDSWRLENNDTELHFVFRTGPDFDGVNFQLRARGAFVEFNPVTFGKQDPKTMLIGPAQRTPSAIPFAFPARAE